MKFTPFLILLLVGQWIIAQIPPVYEEAKHHLVLEIPNVLRVMDIRAMPGDTTLYHLHADDLCYVIVEGAKVWLDAKDGEQKEVNLPDGYVNDNTTHSESPFVHRFANIGETPFRVLAVERLAKKNPAIIKDSLLISKNDLETPVDDEKFRVLKIQLEKGEKIDYFAHQIGILLFLNDGNLAITDTNKTRYLIDKGAWMLVEKQQALILQNKSEEQITLMMIQLK